MLEIGKITADQKEHGMNTVEYVSLTSDTSYIPVKHAVVSATIGNGANASYAWLKCVAYGMATKENLATLKQQAHDDTGNIDLSSLQGTLGAYSVAAISAVEPYSAPECYHFGKWPIG